MTEAQAPSKPDASPSESEASSPKSLPEAKLFEAFNRLQARIHIQTWIVLALTAGLSCILPFSGTVYYYFAVTPDKEVRPLVGLDMPNMTNRAILTWASASITELMTMGFGDMDTTLPLQRSRFTQKGWQNYIEAFEALNVRYIFKHSQLVLTTVPSDTPVVAWQGLNSEKVYEWIVQMPVIMSYATNNNVVRRSHMTVTLTIVRVPSEEISSGLAIKNWGLGVV
jgi:intracellular multiplication protein IcmL